MSAARQITDRAKRYRAQKAVRGKKVCAICGKRPRRIDVMHLDGNESHGEAANLAYGCRSCNGRLAVAFKKIGAGRPTNQYNPSRGVPTYEQYAWAVSQQRHSGEHGEPGAIIHATPKAKRTEYAKRILRKAGTTRRAAHEDRWNPSAELSKSRSIIRKMEALQKLGASSRRDRELEQLGAELKSLRLSLPLSELRKLNPAGDQQAGLATAGMSTTERARALKRHIAEVEEYGRRPLMKSELQILKNRFRAGAKAAKRNPGGTLEREKLGRALLKKKDALQKRWKTAHYSGASTADIERKLQHLDLQVKALMKRNPGAQQFKTLAEARSYAAEMKAIGYAGVSVQRTPYTFAGIGGVPEHYYEVTWGKLANPSRNPAAASAEVYKEFHGHGPREVVTVVKRVHVHEHLAAAGALRRLVVLGIDKRKHTIKEFGGAILAFNENKNQLFVEGGDQSLNLEDYGIDSPHELETLGKVQKIDYKADKSHLGAEGGRATYTHQFRTTNENGRHVVVSVSRYPDLIYDVRNQQLLFSGGSYTIRAEGIDV